MLEQVDPVADFKDLAVVVGDDDDRDVAFSLEITHQIQNERRLLGAHGGERLIQEQDLRIGVDGARDRDRLPLPAGKLCHLDVDRLEPDPHLVQMMPGKLAHLPVVQQRPADKFPLEKDVVVNGQLVDQREILVDRVDSQRAGVIHRLDHDLLAVEHDAPRLGPVEATQDLEERRLPRAVVAEQAEYLTPLEVQVHVAQRGHRAEPLGDVLDPEDIAFRRRRRGCCSCAGAVIRFCPPFAAG